jgi:UDP-N-acetylglucosamine 1-carboxyvinyltransferase
MGHDFQSHESDHYVFTRHSGGYSLLIAALSAKGTSTIQNIEQIDRGYERIDERLRATDIVRVGKIT